MCSPTAVVGQKITAVSPAVSLGLEASQKCQISALSVLVRSLTASAKNIKMDVMFF